jgi:hypothetical protein
MSNQPADPKRVTTGKVRLSYVHLNKPRPAQDGGTPKYSVTLLIPKSDMATRQAIDAAINAAVQDGIQNRWNGVRPPQIPLPIHDGDGPRVNGDPFGEECRGQWVMTASSEQKPEIVDAFMNPIISPTEIYSGMYGRVSIRLYAYNKAGKRGIACGLGNVQKLEDGEPLAGHTSAATDFAGPTPAFSPSFQPQPTYQPPASAYPQQPTYQPPTYPGYPQQPTYQPAPAYPNYPQAPAQAPAPQIDPITGKPLPQGGILGL